MKKFLVPENVLQALGQYLGSKPFSEVVQLVNALQNLEVHPEPEKEEDSKPKSKSVK